MRRSFLVGFVLMLITAALTALLIQPRPDPTSEAKTWLQDARQQARAQIALPAPGDIIHYTTDVYWRSPLGDGHFSHQTEETWIEISPSGMSIRWRTLVLDDRGALVQDLYFDGTTETDYFPKDRRVMIFAGEPGRYQDARLALIDAFMRQDHLSLRRQWDQHTRPVISIYGHQRFFGHSPEEQAAVRNTLSPYLADLTPASDQLRLDLDPDTGVPVALLSVVWDVSGAEHVASIRTFPEPEILSLPPEEVEALFRQDIPPGTPGG